ncbi:UNVERIFIED_CONTAM: hypothetical protein GTU68_056123 [Idotea baltica]|nr:hypothetical protein [Idotea baltica]
MYQGVYHGKKKHEADLTDVLFRAWEGNVDKLIITGTNLADSKAALQYSSEDGRLFSTVGCHPTRCNEFDMENTTPDEYFNELLQLAQSDLKNVVAIGECGLDYERTSFCSIEIQKKYFEKQIALAEVTGLPLFLHCRNAAADLVTILSKYRDNISGGVVHSFDGTSEELQLILDLDLYVGINGW